MSASRCWSPGWRAPSRGAGCRCGRSSRRTCRTTPRSPPTAARSAGPRRCRRAPARTPPVVDMNPVLLKPQIGRRGAGRACRAGCCGSCGARATTARSQAAAAAAGARALRAARRRRPTWCSSRAPAARPRSTCAPATSPIWASPRRPTCRWSWSATSSAAASSRSWSARRRCSCRTSARRLAGYIVNKFRGDPRCSTAASRRSASAPAGAAWASCRGSPTPRSCRRRTMALRLVARPRVRRRMQPATAAVTGQDRRAAAAAHRQFRRSRSAARRARRRPRAGPRRAAAAGAMPTSSSCPARRRPWPISPLCGARAGTSTSWRIVRRGGRVLGLCGGYQMLGRRSPTRTASKAARRGGRARACSRSTPCSAATSGSARRPAASSPPACRCVATRSILGVTSGPGLARPMLDLDGRPDGAVRPTAGSWAAICTGCSPTTLPPGLSGAARRRRRRVRLRGADRGGAGRAGRSSRGCTRPRRLLAAARPPASPGG